MVPSQQQHNNNNKNRRSFPLPDLSAAPQIKTRTHSIQSPECTKKNMFFFLKKTIFDDSSYIPIFPKIETPTQKNPKILRNCPGGILWKPSSIYSVPDFPGAPGIPGIPSIPGTPSSPFLPGTPSRPGSPGRPSRPSKPGTPKQTKYKGPKSHSRYDQNEKRPFGGLWFHLLFPRYKTLCVSIVQWWIREYEKRVNRTIYDLYLRRSRQVKECSVFFLLLFFCSWEEGTTFPSYVHISKVYSKVYPS